MYSPKASSADFSTLQLVFIRSDTLIELSIEEQLFSVLIFFECLSAKHQTLALVEIIHFWTNLHLPSPIRCFDCSADFPHV